MTATIKLIAGVVGVAAVATLGDYVWFTFGVQHQMVIGVLHGALLLMAAGGALGWPAGRTRAGLAIGIGAGVLGALAYYALVSIVGQAAMIAAWLAVWLLLAAGEGLVIQRPMRPLVRIVVSGVVAATLSGIAFYAISSIVWGRAPAEGRNYGQQFACWLLAWAPGLIAIGGVQRRSPPSSAQ